MEDKLPAEASIIAPEQGSPTAKRRGRRMLWLVLLAAHPALAPEARIALTLRLLGGLTVPEIARALLRGEEAVAKRIQRAKAKIRQWFAKERREEHLEAGRDALAAEVQRGGLPLHRLFTADSMNKVATQLHYDGVDALYTAKPGTPGAERVAEVGDPAELASISIGGTGSAVGSGGMTTKVEAATIAGAAGIPTVLTSADNVTAALAGEDVGTAFRPQRRSRGSRALWLAQALLACACVVLAAQRRQRAIGWPLALLAPFVVLPHYPLAAVAAALAIAALHSDRAAGWLARDAPDVRGP